MRKRPSWRAATRSACASSFKWKDRVAGGTPSASARRPAASPADPALTRRRNKARRVSCASAASARSAFVDSIFLQLSKYGRAVNPGRGSTLFLRSGRRPAHEPQDQQQRGQTDRRGVNEEGGIAEGVHDVSPPAGQALG